VCTGFINIFMKNYDTTAISVCCGFRRRFFQPLTDWLTDWLTFSLTHWQPPPRICRNHWHSITSQDLNMQGLSQLRAGSLHVTQCSLRRFNPWGTPCFAVPHTGNKSELQQISVKLLLSACKIRCAHVFTCSLHPMSTQTGHTNFVVYTFQWFIHCFPHNSF
jgi:hypothetical protein